MTVLTSIIASKRNEIPLLDEVLVPPRKNDSHFVKSLLSKRPSLIAEIKPQSPSGGILINRTLVPSLVQQYASRAQALSVLCDKSFFGGGYDLLAEVRALTKLPLLAKEFIVDVKQIDHAVLNGADAILLIAAIVNEEQLRMLARYARTKKIDVLFEAHDQSDVKKIAATYNNFSPADQKHLVVGVNNRNLSDLSVGLAVTEKLTPLIRSTISQNVLLVSESGIATREDVERLSRYVGGFLVGTSLLQSKNIEQHINSLF